MEIRNIVTFIRVAELLSFSRAAEQLNYSQSALTVQIKQLEDELEVKLFERIGKKISLTEHGKNFVPHAQEILKALNGAKAFTNPDIEPKGHLRVGAVHSLFTSVLAKLLTGFHKKYPKIEVEIKVANPAELLQMVRQNDVDIVYILDQPAYGKEWIKTLEKKEDIIFVASAKHPIAKCSAVLLKDIVNEPFILTEKGMCYRYSLELIMAKQKIDIEPYLETSYPDVIVNILKQNVVMSFIPRYAAEDAISAGELVEINVTDVNISLWGQVIYHHDKVVTPQMQAFVQLLEEYYNIEKESVTP